MKKFLFAALVFASPYSAFAGALDLTPHPITTTFKGLRVNRYFFEDAGKRMAFRIDNNMTVRGSDGSAVFEFEDVKSSGMKILRSLKNAGMSFSDKDLESYRVAARALVPPGATEVLIDQEKSDAIAINGWTSYQFVFTYKQSGSAYRRSIVFLNYDTAEQLIVDVSAPSSEFDRVYVRSYQVLNSLSELSSKDSTGPT